MGTPYVEIYDMFLGDIRDERLVDLLTPEELGDTLEDYLMEAADVHFQRCQKDLSNRDSSLMQFNESLTNLEKRILAKAMRLKWLSSNFVANESLLKSRLTTKDYNVFSPSNQLKVLIDIEKEFKSELKSLMMRYQYDNWIRG